MSSVAISGEKPKKQVLVLLQLAWPVVISQVSHTFVGLADTLMVGNTGNVGSLAASSLANNIFSIPIIFCIGISFILSPRISEALAAGKEDECRNLLKAAFISNLIWSLLLGLFFYLLIPFADALGQPKEIIRQASPFFELLLWGLPGLMLFQTFRLFFDGIGDTRPGMLVSILANLLNVLLNYLLIYGKAGFPELGLMGAGISNLISRCLMGLGMFACFLYFRKTESWRKGFWKVRPSKKTFFELNRLGIPVALQYLFEVGAFACTALLVGRMGEQSLAAHQIVITMASVTYMMASGLSSAASIRVGHFMGLKNVPMIRKSGWISFQMVAVFMLMNALLFIVFRNVLPQLFIPDPEVQKVAASLLVIAGFFQLSDGVQVIGLGCLRGISDVFIPTIITIIAYWGIGIPLGYFLGISMNLGAAGTWWGLLAGLSFSGIFLFIRFFIRTGKLHFVENELQAN
jgi:MATE family multidrug resistance protein